MLSYDTRRNSMAMALALYVHKPEAPDKAVSYVWADPQARLIGIHLRWVQGSCTYEEQPA